jgi:hypothetical protein
VKGVIRLGDRLVAEPKKGKPGHLWTRTSMKALPKPLSHIVLHGGGSGSEGGLSPTHQDLFSALVGPSPSVPSHDSPLGARLRACSHPAPSTGLPSAGGGAH